MERYLFAKFRVPKTGLNKLVTTKQLEDHHGATPKAVPTDIYQWMVPPYFISPWFLHTMLKLF